MRLGGYNSDDHDETGCAIPYGNEKRIPKDPGKADAGRDGFTVVGRRVTSAAPGTIESAKDADKRDAFADEMRSMFPAEDDGDGPKNPIGGY